MVASRRSPGGATEARALGGWPILGLLLLTMSGCRLHLEYVEVGRHWEPEAFDHLEIGRSDRGHVLELLGPPDGVSYTLEHEILDYRVGGHRGTDLQFVLPTSAIPGFAFVANYRDLIDFFFPPIESDGNFGQRSAGERGASILLGIAQSFIPFSSTEDSLSFYGRRVRYDTLRVVLDRESLTLLQKELWLGIEVGRTESLFGSAFLSD